MQFIATATTRTLELLRLRRSHIKGVGWMPVYESAEIIYYQKNGVVLKIKLGCWSRRPSRYGRCTNRSADWC